VWIAISLVVIAPLYHTISGWQILQQFSLWPLP
jgi:hypothetical protein